MDVNQTCVTRWPQCGPLGFIHDSEMVFQINCILQFLRATHFTTIPEQKNVTIFKYL